jgi:hypothetical protein
VKNTSRGRITRIASKEDERVRIASEEDEKGRLASEEY